MSIDFSKYQTQAAQEAPEQSSPGTAPRPVRPLAASTTPPQSVDDVRRGLLPGLPGKPTLSPEERAQSQSELGMLVSLGTAMAPPMFASAARLPKLAVAGSGALGDVFSQMTRGRVPFSEENGVDPVEASLVGAFSNLPLPFGRTASRITTAGKQAGASTFARRGAPVAARALRTGGAATLGGGVNTLIGMSELGRQQPELPWTERLSKSFTDYGPSGALFGGALHTAIGEPVWPGTRPAGQVVTEAIASRMGRTLPGPPPPPAQRSPGTPPGIPPERAQNQRRMDTLNKLDRPIFGQEEAQKFTRYLHGLPEGTKIHIDPGTTTEYTLTVQPITSGKSRYKTIHLLNDDGSIYGTVMSSSNLNTGLANQMYEGISKGKWFVEHVPDMAKATPPTPEAGSHARYAHKPSQGWYPSADPSDPTGPMGVAGPGGQINPADVVPGRVGLTSTTQLPWSVKLPPAPPPIAEAAAEVAAAPTTAQRPTPVGGLDAIAGASQSTLPNKKPSAPSMAQKKVDKINKVTEQQITAAVKKLRSEIKEAGKSQIPAENVVQTWEKYPEGSAERTAVTRIMARAAQRLAARTGKEPPAPPLKLADQVTPNKAASRKTKTVRVKRAVPPPPPPPQRAPVVQEQSTIAPQATAPFTVGQGVTNKETGVHGKITIVEPVQQTGTFKVRAEFEDGTSKESVIPATQRPVASTEPNLGTRAQTRSKAPSPQAAVAATITQPAASAGAAPAKPTGPSAIEAARAKMRAAAQKLKSEKGTVESSTFSGPGILRRAWNRLTAPPDQGAGGGAKKTKLAPVQAAIKFAAPEKKSYPIAAKAGGKTVEGIPDQLADEYASIIHDSHLREPDIQQLLVEEHGNAVASASVHKIRQAFIRKYGRTIRDWWDNAFKLPPKSPEERAAARREYEARQSRRDYEEEVARREAPSLSDEEPISAEQIAASDISDAFDMMAAEGGVKAIPKTKLAKPEKTSRAEVVKDAIADEHEVQQLMGMGMTQEGAQKAALAAAKRRMANTKIEWVTFRTKDGVFRKDADGSSFYTRWMNDLNTEQRNRETAGSPKLQIVFRKVGNDLRVGLIDEARDPFRNMPAEARGDDLYTWATENLDAQQMEALAGELRLQDMQQRARAMGERGADKPEAQLTADQLKARREAQAKRATPKETFKLFDKERPAAEIAAELRAATEFHRERQLMTEKQRIRARGPVAYEKPPTKPLSPRSPAASHPPTTFGRAARPVLQPFKESSEAFLRMRQLTDKKTGELRGQRAPLGREIPKINHYGIAAGKPEPLVPYAPTVPAHAFKSGYRLQSRVHEGKFVGQDVVETTELDLSKPLKDRTGRQIMKPVVGEGGVPVTTRVLSDRLSRPAPIDQARRRELPPPPQGKFPEPPTRKQATSNAVAIAPLAVEPRRAAVDSGKPAPIKRPTRTLFGNRSWSDLRNMWKAAEKGDPRYTKIKDLIVAEMQRRKTQTTLLRRKETSRGGVIFKKAESAKPGEATTTDTGGRRFGGAQRAIPAPPMRGDYAVPGEAAFFRPGSPEIDQFMALNQNQKAALRMRIMNWRKKSADELRTILDDPKLDETAQLAAKGLLARMIQQGKEPALLSARGGPQRPLASSVSRLSSRLTETARRFAQEEKGELDLSRAADAYSRFKEKRVLHHILSNLKAVGARTNEMQKWVYRNQLTREWELEAIKRGFGPQTAEESADYTFRREIGGGGGGAEATFEEFRQQFGKPLRKLSTLEQKAFFDDVDEVGDFYQFQRAGVLVEDHLNQAKVLLSTIKSALKAGPPPWTSESVWRRELSARLKEARAAVRTQRLARSRVFNAESQPVSPDEAQQMMLKKLESIPEPRRKMVEDAIQFMEKSNATALDNVLVPSGLVSKEAAAVWKSRNQYIAPMERLLANIGTARLHALGKSGAQAMSHAHGTSVSIPAELRAFEGIRALPLERATSAWSHRMMLLHREAAHNNAARAMADLFGKAFPDAVYEAAPGADVPYGFVEMPVWRDGVKEVWHVPAELSMPYLELAPEEIAAVLGTPKWLRYTRDLFTKTATTYAAGFFVANPWRDVSEARWGARTRAGKPLYDFFSPKDWAKAHTYEWGKNFVEALKKSPYYLAMIRAKAGQSGLTASTSPSVHWKPYFTINAETGERTITMKYKGFFKGYSIAEITSAAENATKLMTWKRAKAMGISDAEAADITREWGGSPDFAQGGTYRGWMSVLGMFVNPNIQERARIGRTIADTKRGIGGAGRILARGVLGSLGAALALDKWNGEFADEKGLPEIDHVDKRVRETSTVIFLPWKVEQTDGSVRWAYVRAPKTTPAIIAHSLIDPALEYVKTSKAPNGAEFANQFVNAVMPGSGKWDVKDIGGSVFRSAVSMAHPVIGAPAELATGKSAFTGQSLRPMRVSQRSPEMQISASTNPGIVKLAQTINKWAPVFDALNLSPIEAEYLLRKAMPGPTQIALSTMSSIGELTGKLHTTDTTPYGMARNAPFGAGQMISRFTGPGTMDQTVYEARTRLYDAQRAARRAKADESVREQKWQSNYLRSPEGRRWINNPNKVKVVNSLVDQLGTVQKLQDKLVQDLLNTKPTPEAQAEYVKKARQLAKIESAILKSSDRILGAEPRVPVKNPWFTLAKK